MKNDIELLNFNRLDESINNNFSNALGTATQTVISNNTPSSQLATASEYVYDSSNSTSISTGVRNSIQNIQAKRNEKVKSVKQKFIFNQPFTVSAKKKKSNSGEAFRKVTYNVGDTIEGIVVTTKYNGKSGEVSQNKLIVDIGDAMFQIILSDNSAISPYTEPTMQYTSEKEVAKNAETKTPEEAKNTDVIKEKAPSEGWSTNKKIIVGVSVVAALGTIFGILKWKKVI